MSEAVYTIGHSSRSVEELIGMLLEQGITTVADVRSQPYSRLHSQFNREAFSFDLGARGIGYVYLGAELGARSGDSSCYLNGKVQYPQLAKTALFRQGLERIRAGMEKNLRISLLCAEKEPLACHRSILISRHLVESGIVVRHILDDKTVEEHSATMQRLLFLLKMGGGNLFLSEAEILEEAYAIQGEKIAYDSRAKWDEDKEGLSA
jgi:uncharacterized protein (DUF488 family)